MRRLLPILFVAAGAVVLNARTAETVDPVAPRRTVERALLPPQSSPDTWFPHVAAVEHAR